MLSTWRNFIIRDAVPISVSSHGSVLVSSPCSVFVLSAAIGVSNPLWIEKTFISVSKSLSAQFKANSICSVRYVTRTPYCGPANSVNARKGATISRNLWSEGQGTGGWRVRKRPVRIQNWDMGCKAAGSGGPDGDNLWPWFPGCHRCWHPFADSACRRNTDIQTLNVTPVSPGA